MAKMLQIKNLNFDAHQLEKDDWNNDVSINCDGSEICGFYSKKSVFITGGSGFLGRVLIEKLLRACGDRVDTLYIMCRDKKGKDIKHRLDDIFNNVLFQKLDKIHPNFREKIIPIAGDASLPNLGISNHDRAILTEKVSIIYHLAATVRFDEKLKQAVAVNIKATKAMLELARECKKMQSFIYCSTAFSNCPLTHIKEEVYDPFIDTQSIINIVDSTPEGILDKITPDLLGEWPNTYSYTKAIAESTVREYGKGLPLCIFRPSMVIGTYQEPIRGWIDNMYGPTGISLGAGVGLIHSLHCDPDVNAEMVPVDLVVNGMIAASYKNSIENCQEIPVYNYVSSSQNPMTWRSFEATSSHYGINVPPSVAVWVYDFTLNKCKYVHGLYVAFLHFLPAILVDAVCIVLGKKVQLVKAYKKIHKFSTVISYFSTREWSFDDENVVSLWKGTSEVDKVIFNFDLKAMDWDYLLQFNCIGVRLYLLKDPLATVPEGKKLWRRYRVIQKVIKTIYYVFWAWIVYKIYGFVFGTMF